MALRTADYEIDQGADWAPPAVTWSGHDLSRYEAHLQVRDPSGAVLLDLTSGSGAIALGADGTIAWVAPAVDTAALAAQTARYDLKLTAPGGGVTRVLEGRVVISPQVTI